MTSANQCRFYIATVEFTQIPVAARESSGFSGEKHGEDDVKQLLIKSYVFSFSTVFNTTSSFDCPVFVPHENYRTTRLWGIKDRIFKPNPNLHIKIATIQSFTRKNFFHNQKRIDSVLSHGNLASMVEFSRLIWQFSVDIILVQSLVLLIRGNESLFPTNYSVLMMLMLH